MRGDPRLANHPMTRRPGWKRKAIPFAIHGDSVPVACVGRAGTKSLDCVSTNPILAKGTTLEIKWLAFGLFLHNFAPETSGQAWRVFVWSLVAMYRGKHPSLRWDGVAWDVGSSQKLLGDGGAELADGFFWSRVEHQGGLGLVFEGVPHDEIQRRRTPLRLVPLQQDRTPPQLASLFRCDVALETCLAIEGTMESVEGRWHALFIQGFLVSISTKHGP